MRGNVRVLSVAAAAALMLTGCMTDVPTTNPSTGSQDDVAVEDSTNVEDDESDSTPILSEGPSKDAEAEEAEAEEPVVADEDIMASMVCEPLVDASGSNNLAMMFGYFDKAVSVEVGENNGQTWWVVVFEWDGEDGVVGLREAYLTNSLELPSYRDGKWIELNSSDPWHDVDWSHDMLVRGQSALTLARDTLANS